MLLYKEVVRNIQNISISHYEDKRPILEEGWFGPKDTGRWIAGNYYQVANKITMWNGSTDDSKLSILIHELIHAANYFGFDESQRRMFMEDKKWYNGWFKKNILIESYREEMIAYHGQSILSKQLELREECIKSALFMYNLYKEKLEKLLGHACSIEEEQMLNEMSNKRLKIINEHYYRFV